MRDQRLTPFQRDYLRMADALNIAISAVGAADEALTRRIVSQDKAQGERVHVNSSDPTDPTGDEVARRVDAQERRENYRDIAITKVWEAIKRAQRETDHVLRNEPATTPPGAIVCATKDCTNFASTHQHPETESPINDLCDDCWRKVCTRCYVRPKDQYRTACFTCYQRELRQQKGDAA